MLLFIGHAPRQADSSVGSAAVVAVLEALGAMGLDVVFLAADFQCSEQFAAVLGRLDIGVLEGEWYRENWQDWFSDSGQGIDYVLFNDPDSVAVFAHPVQRFTDAPVLYLCGDPELSGQLDDAGAQGHGTLSDGRSAGVGKEAFVFSNCDVVLAVEETQGRYVREKFPHKKVFTLSASGDSLSEAFAAARAESCYRLAKRSVESSTQKPVRLIAFYLPQYHPIPENNEWWGEGFTEWHNVSKATPLFSGHYQPHVPAELGYYDLREEQTRIAQAELAKQYGVEGFCYYHYWFKGKRLLERPVEELLKSGKPDFPFCLCWANESWTRRWDGKEQDILMKQEYSEEDDREHIKALIPVFKDKRYIRVNGRPLFLVYRSENFPDPSRTAEIWREEARKAGIADLYLCHVESFVKSDPAESGFDASVEFAPDWWNKGPQLTSETEMFREASSEVKEACDNNYIHSYQGLVEGMLAKEIPAYRWFRCVTPSWDNWARRHEGASVFLDSTPDKYQAWLSRIVDYTASRYLGQERIAFINAWNEWAEGNHLEPDQKFGRGYLESTKQALVEGHAATVARRAAATDTSKVNSLMVQLASQQQQLAEKQAQLVELSGQVNEILHSTSWRLTTPVRWVKQHLLDLKNKYSN